MTITPFSPKDKLPEPYEICIISHLGVTQNQTFQFMRADCDEHYIGKCDGPIEHWFQYEGKAIHQIPTSEIDLWVSLPKLIQ